jgi:hypothetical protein
MATNIKITDNRYGDSFRTGVNGLLYDIPVNREVLVEDALADHIRGLGVAFEQPRPASKGASGSEEGSGDQLAPIGRAFGGASYVEAPAMRPQSLDNNGGGQPGDVTGSAVPADDEDELTPYAEPSPNVIEENAEVSDVRVKGERRAHQQASVAEIAGEGEGGTTPAEGETEPPITRSAPKEAAKQERVAPKDDRKDERK